MSSTFLTFDNQTGYWVNDGDLRLWIRLLALNFEYAVKGKEAEALNCLRNKWLLASHRSTLSAGNVPYEVPEYLRIDAVKAEVLKANEMLIQRLSTVGENIDGRVLNLLGLQGIYCGSFPTKMLNEFGAAFGHLLEGKRGLSPDDSSFMPGRLQNPTSQP